MITVLEGGLTAVPGFLAAGVRANVKRRGLDIMMLVSEDGPVPAAGSFTTNLVRGAPLLVTMEHLKDGKLAAVVANSGNANAYTGKQGIRDARQMARLAAKLLKLRSNDLAVASTGLIGMRLPMRRIEAGIRAAVEELSSSREASLNAARAIMTTDTFPKEIAIRVNLEDGTTINIAGVAKGAGMIRPRMRVATMLALIVTDATVTPAALRAALQNSVERSFNMITVDDDTSTNDMVLIMANGRAKNRPITIKHIDKMFQSGLDYVLIELARMIVRDGEGAAHLIEVRVKNARNEGDARRAALAVAGSNLVKAAVFGRDPNWGRVIAALGYSGASFDPSKISLEFVSDRGRVNLVERGKPKPRRALERARDIMRCREIEVHVDLAAGKAEAVAWGCDLTYDYVRINSRYTT
ncbi:MAG: bifunctional glutamate N-acetyltransferase/amino-acid acetyltransferase ArgJ [Candidatus Hodarchaeaceae archaeon]|nr:bifunctional glutamate N-acetyltransferase/amino-acid acetyltransferase ArgJ [Candidatus Hodarchaeaceae archaeon]